VTRWYAAIALVALAAVWTTLDEARDNGDPVIGPILWLFYLVAALLAAAAIVGLVSAARRRRPSRRLLLVVLLVALVAAFPMPASWDSVEGPDSVGGLAPSVEAASLALALETTPALWYSETCCG
jgi:peptidoglycan/LPS O-acetylase OafA/YrhL